MSALDAIRRIRAAESDLAAAALASRSASASSSSAASPSSSSAGGSASVSSSPSQPAAGGGRARVLLLGVGESNKTTLDELAAFIDAGLDGHVFAGSIIANEVAAFLSAKKANPAQFILSHG